MVTHPAQFIGIAAVSGLIAFWLSTPEPDVVASQASARPSAAPDVESGLAERPDDDGSPSASPASRQLRKSREDREALRRAAERRDLLKAIVDGLETSRKMREAEARGEHYLPPTIRNCARIVGAGKRDDCPLPFESTETLEFLAECDVLNFDIPWHIYDRSRDHRDPPWEDLSVTAEQRRALARVDQDLEQRLYPLMKEAYREIFQREPPEGASLSDFHVEAMSVDDSDIAWAYGLAARIRLGEASEAELEDLPPRARYMATLAISGDVYERAVADVLAPEQARALRRRDSGWGAQGVSGGGRCAGTDLPEEP